MSGSVPKFISFENEIIHQSRKKRGKRDLWTKFGNSGHSAYSRPLGKIIIKRLSAILCNEVKAFIQEFSDFHEAAISQDFFYFSMYLI